MVDVLTINWLNAPITCMPWPFHPWPCTLLRSWATGGATLSHDWRVQTNSLHKLNPANQLIVSSEKNLQFAINTRPTVERFHSIYSANSHATHVHVQVCSTRKMIMFTCLYYSYMLCCTCGLYFREVWELRPMVLRRHKPLYNDGLLSTDMLDSILREVRISDSFILSFYLFCWQ